MLQFIRIHSDFGRQCLQTLFILIIELFGIPINLSGKPNFLLQIEGELKLSGFWLNSRFCLRALGKNKPYRVRDAADIYINTHGGRSSEGFRKEKKGLSGMEVLDSWVPQLWVFILSVCPTGKCCVCNFPSDLPSTLWRQLKAYPRTTDSQWLEGG